MSTSEKPTVEVPVGTDPSYQLELEDIVVGDTPDAILVTTRERAQEVKAIVERLKASGRGQLT